MEQQSTQVSPFCVCILHTQAHNCPNTSDTRRANLSPLLPASYRTPEDDLIPPIPDDISYFENELGVGRLNELSRWLWLAGRPMPPRPLHYQLLLGRGIIIAEQMDLHLVWTSGRIFLKPMPRYLLEPCFWTACLACQHDHSCSPAAEKPCSNQKVWRCALGFLFSYAALICYESDFLLARERHLLPDEIRWCDWKKLVNELDTERIYDKIDPRYLYGELRLSRLNKIQYLRSSFLRGYMPSWHRYSEFFHDNFTWLASAIVYIAIILAALQVGLATDILTQSHAFQSASYGFAVFAIIGPFAILVTIFCVFIYVFLSNWIAAEAYRTQRLTHVHAKLEAA